ncbi:McrB family protein [Myroides odoratus]
MIKNDSIKTAKAEKHKMAKHAKHPLNQILYGPPGTGKTYKLQHSLYKFFEADNKKISKQEFEFQIVSKLSWWQVCTLVLLDAPKLTVPEIKKHRFLTYKRAVSNTNNLNQTLWGQLSAHTVKDSKTVEYSKRTEPLIFDKSSDSIWEIENEKQDLIGDLVELYNEISSYKETTITSKNYKFITFHQSFNYEDFVEGIKPTINNEQNEEISEVTYSIVKGVLYNCCDEAAKLAGFLSLKDSIDNYTKEERASKYKQALPYGLFIDEINRGNIAQIFGELITLIEDTKRLGNDEIIVELPYSKSNFGVPPNLYIIGTMNTADRSVEALDTALRRRFVFEEMLPVYDLQELQQSLYGFSAAEILQTINNRIEKLLDRDHLIGHAYFINKDEATIITSFYKNIIPLLQEYFFGDYGKIGLVLGAGFIEVVETTSIFASFNAVDYSQFEDRASYTIINHKNDPVAFGAAIQLLMN